MDAFELLADETRAGILRALAAHQRDDFDGEGLAFSELRERVGVRDSGNFNHHLGKLTDRFVRNDGDGYQLAAPGWRLVGAVLSGGYTKALDADPVETSVPCVTCGSGMVLRFPGDKVEMQCEECGQTYTNTPIPAGIFEGVTPERAPSVVDRWLKRLHSTADYGFCPNCDGRLDRSVRLPGDEDAPVDFEADDEAFAHYECIRCGFGWYSSFPFVVVFHPAIVSLYHDHGIDVRKTPFWDLDGLEAQAATVRSEDPLRVDVSVNIGDETVVLTFDDDFELVGEYR